MKTCQRFLLSALLLVTISHALQFTKFYQRLPPFVVSVACQRKYESCGGLQTKPNDYCSQVKNTKQCATTGSVEKLGTIAMCTDREYQRAIDVACMSAEQRQKLRELRNYTGELSGECRNAFLNCFGRSWSPTSPKEYCKAIKEADACLAFTASVKQSCKPTYEEIKALV